MASDSRRRPPPARPPTTFESLNALIRTLVEFVTRVIGDEKVIGDWNRVLQVLVLVCGLPVILTVVALTVIFYLRLSGQRWLYAGGASATIIAIMVAKQKVTSWRRSRTARKDSAQPSRDSGSVAAKDDRENDDGDDLERNG